MARGVAGTYGADTGNHPNRQVGSGGGGGGGDFGPGGGIGGGDFPGPPAPTSPPQSEQSGRGAVINPNTAEYSPVTGSPGRYYTPDRAMTVGVRHANEATSPPLSEQPGRGVFGMNAATKFFQQNQPQTISNMGPVGDFINDRQFTPS